jgi:hypothetical protein
MNLAIREQEMIRHAGRIRVPQESQSKQLAPFERQNYSQACGHDVRLLPIRDADVIKSDS